MFWSILFMILPSISCDSILLYMKSCSFFNWFFFQQCYFSCEVTREQQKSQNLSLEMRWLPWQCSQLLLVPDEKIIFRLLHYKVRLQRFKLNGIANWSKSKISTLLAKNLWANNQLTLLNQIFVQVLTKYFLLFVFDQILEVKLVHWNGKCFHLTDFTKCLFCSRNYPETDWYLDKSCLKYDSEFESYFAICQIWIKPEMLDIFKVYYLWSPGSWWWKRWLFWWSLVNLTLSRIITNTSSVVLCLASIKNLQAWRFPSPSGKAVPMLHCSWWISFPKCPVWTSQVTGYVIAPCYG